MMLLTMSKGLNERQRKFVERYMAHGNGTMAAIEAGYSEARAAATASRMLATNGKIIKAIEDRQRSDPLIATREERQRFWTRVMNGEEADATMSDRLRAAELLGKTGGDFTERSDGKLTIRIIRE